MEVRDEIDREHGRSRQWLPVDAIAENLGTLVTRLPSLDEGSVDVHDPVFGDRLTLIEPALRDAVTPRGRWRDDFNREQEAPRFLPAARTSAVDEGDNEDVGAGVTSSSPAMIS